MKVLKLKAVNKKVKKFIDVFYKQCKKMFPEGEGKSFELVEEK